MGTVEDTVRRVVPDVVFDFAEDPRGFIWGIIIGGVLTIWARFLDEIASVWSYLAGVPETAIVNPMLSALGVFSIVPETYVAVGETVTSMATGAGVFAPLALLAGWAVPTLMMIAALYFVIGLIDAYIPVTSIPYVGEWLQ